MNYSIQGPESDFLGDRVDAALVSFYGKVGELWQNKTYRSVGDLTKSLYGLSTALFAYSSMNIQSFWKYVSASQTLLSFIHLLIPQTNSDADKFRELSLDRFGKAYNLAFYSSGVVLIPAGIFYILQGIHTSNNDLLSQGLTILAYGFGNLAYYSADYMKRERV